ncbi:uncharacterized protein LOC122530651 [Frieseomelitta varia]|uniref:uncharacterized protein LOC122530651 n=1 Tax=Frieseomelitta varia TaxID=561572 RepID=UPI001CB684E1|nr:uncharacterized protein LOC122530651 [Frieseomelitta varia]
MQYTSYGSRTYRYFSRSIFKRKTWRKGAHHICEEESFVQKNYSGKKYQQFSVNISCEMCDYRANRKVHNTHPTILEHIDISQDQFFNGKMAEGSTPRLCDERKCSSEISLKKKYHSEILK